MAVEKVKVEGEAGTGWEGEDGGIRRSGHAPASVGLCTSVDRGRKGEADGFIRRQSRRRLGRQYIACTAGIGFLARRALELEARGWRLEAGGWRPTRVDKRTRMGVITARAPIRLAAGGPIWERVGCRISNLGLLGRCSRPPWPVRPNRRRPPRPWSPVACTMHLNQIATSTLGTRYGGGRGTRDEGHRRACRCWPLGRARRAYCHSAAMPCTSTASESQRPTAAPLVSTSTSTRCSITYIHPPLAADSPHRRKRWPVLAQKCHHRKQKLRLVNHAVHVVNVAPSKSLGIAVKGQKVKVCGCHATKLPRKKNTVAASQDNLRLDRVWPAI